MPGAVCEAEIGLYMDGAVPPDVSIGAATGCAEPATVTLEASCGCCGTKRKRLCAYHGQTSPADGVWFCGSCARAGHDCAITPRVVDGITA